MSDLHRHDRGQEGLENRRDAVNAAMDSLEWNAKVTCRMATDGRPEWLWSVAIAGSCPDGSEDIDQGYEPSMIDAYNAMGVALRREMKLEAERIVDKQQNKEY